MAKIALIHGLNLEPGRMSPLGQAMREEGFAPVPLVLAGHGPQHSLESLHEVTAGAWVQQCAEMRTEQAFVGALAYSLGALVWLATLAGVPNSADRDLPRFQVLLAPAVGLRWYTRIIQLLLPFRRLRIPSLSHPEYRRHKALPVAAYRALFLLIRDLREKAASGLKLDIPTLVVLNKRDELVDHKQTLELLSQILVEPPRCIFVNSRAARLTPSYAHLMLDKESLGEDEYLRLLLEVTGFVRQFK